MIQAAARARIARKRVGALLKQRAEQRKLAEFNKYKKKGKKSPGNSKTTTPRKGDSDTVGTQERGGDDGDESGHDENAAFSAEIEEKLKRLQEIESNILARERSMMEAARHAEERAAEVAKALAIMEERARKEDAESKARAELMALAAGPIASGRNSSRPSARLTSRSHEGPPTARSARGGAGIPPHAPRVMHNGEEWVQLWDPDEHSVYWYCERTQAAQWEEPGTESGYESAGALTDYSTDNYESGGEYTDSEYGGEQSQWQEFWDEQAQAKYWYNNNTVRSLQTCISPILIDN